MPDGIGLIAAQHLAEETMLALIERQVVDQAERSDLWKIKSAQSLLARADVERVLRPSDAVATAAGGEDLTGIIQRLTPGKGCRTTQAMPFADAEFAL